MQPEKDPLQYKHAFDVEEIARELIDAYHSHLSTARIKYVFRSVPAEERGQIVWGKAKKVTGLNAWLTVEADQKTYEKSEPQPFFVMEIAETVWVQLEEKQKRALVDHELTHFDVDVDTGKYSLRPHDLEEFNIIVRRHGLWRDEVKLFVDAVKLPLFPEKKVAEMMTANQD